MDRQKVLAFCHKNGLYFHRISCNAIRASPTETDAHYKAKALLGWELMKKGQTIFQVRVNKQHLGLARQALERASKKLPCACSILVTEKK